MPRMFDGRNAVRDTDQAESDHRILLDFYSRLGNVTRPYLLTAIKQERHRIPDYTWGRVALGFMKGFTQSGAPSSRFEGVENKDDSPKSKQTALSREQTKKLVRNSIDRVVEANDIDNINTLELDERVENTSRAIINAWLTDLDQNYWKGMRLNAFLLRKGSEKGLLEEALAPFQVEGLRDAFICAMNVFAESLYADGESVIKLPLGLNLTPVNTSLAESDEQLRRFAVYRTADLPKNLTIPIDNSAFDLANNRNANANISMTDDEFSIEYATLWVRILNEALKESIQELNEVVLPTPFEDRYIDNIAHIAQQNYGLHGFSTTTARSLMHEFSDQLRDISSDELFFDGGLRLHREEGKRIIERTGTATASDIASSLIASFRAMRGAFHSLPKEVTT